MAARASAPRRRPSRDRRPSGSTAAACSRFRSAGRERAQRLLTGLGGEALASGAGRARQRGGRRSGPCRRRSCRRASGGCGGSWATWAGGRWTWTPPAWTPSPQRCCSESPASALLLCLRSKHPSPELKQRGQRTSELAARVLPGVTAAVHCGRGCVRVLSRCGVRCAACPVHSSSGAQAGRARSPARPMQVHSKCWPGLRGRYDAQRDRCRCRARRHQCAAARGAYAPDLLLAFTTERQTWPKRCTLLFGVGTVQSVRGAQQGCRGKDGRNKQQKGGARKCGSAACRRWPRLLLSSYPRSASMRTASRERAH